jgi:hypothetical protein
MIYIIVALLNIRLRVIGFPLNLWVGSQVGLENRDSKPYHLLLKLISRNNGATFIVLFE